MKTKKWLWITLTVLLTLVVLAGVAAAGFRLGMTQNATFLPRQDFRAQRLQDANPGGQMVNPHAQGFDPAPPNGWMENPRAQGFNPRNNPMRGFNDGRNFDRRGGFFPPLFGFLRLLAFGALIWLGYKLVKNSGWKLVREAQPSAAVGESAPPNAEEKNSEA
ncbi:MAG: hypothetical protein PHQ36_05360 [Anaerolineales bacterium]|nr:hypothetical protein [Anaerolineales bacterium]